MAVQAAYATKISAGSGVSTSDLTVADVVSQYVSDNGENSASAGSTANTMKVGTYTVTLKPTTQTTGKSFQAVTKDDVK